jgi:hypothetical protein
MIINKLSDSNLINQFIKGVYHEEKRGNEVKFKYEREKKAVNRGKVDKINVKGKYRINKMRRAN